MYLIVDSFVFITDPPNGPVLFCSLVSVVCRRRRLSGSVTLPAGGPAGRVGGRRAGCVGGRAADTPRRVQYGYIPFGRHLVLLCRNSTKAREFVDCTALLSHTCCSECLDLYVNRVARCHHICWSDVNVS